MVKVEGEARGLELSVSGLAFAQRAGKKLREVHSSLLPLLRREGADTKRMVCREEDSPSPSVSGLRESTFSFRTDTPSLCSGARLLSTRSLGQVELNDVDDSCPRPTELSVHDVLSHLHSPSSLLSDITHLTTCTSPVMGWAPTEPLTLGPLLVSIALSRSTPLSLARHARL